ncbi:hypothetical protein L1987_83681 [Smallanthus sonchifolius]|uniref:Uncharacterized protein n=1 Tax=Smallanthus sonchifolius TaxID=185202 RepID=A0ACB8YDQ9_9ASTR|nr:hypothetical protein L1987_83681 [Smallanthus sonchifolius]
MASCLTKSKNLIIYNLRSKLSLSNRTSSVANPLLHPHLRHTISSPSSLPVRKRASYSIVNGFDRWFEPAFVGRRSHSTTCVSSDVSQLPIEPPSQQVLDFPGGKVKFTKKTDIHIQFYRGKGPLLPRA